jgi:uncharacterized membrane protein
MTDRRLELILGTLLRVGVALSAAVVLGGGVWYLAALGMAPTNYRHFHAGPRGSMVGMSGPEMTIQVGLLILIATPVARVIFSLMGFALERDRVYVAITLVVLAILAYSIGSAWL